MINSLLCSPKDPHLLNWLLKDSINLSEVDDIEKLLKMAQTRNYRRLTILLAIVLFSENKTPFLKVFHKKDILPLLKESIQANPELIQFLLKNNLISKDIKRSLEICLIKDRTNT